MKIALIGYGNIANAIINGMLSSEKTKAMDDIYVFHNKEQNSIHRDKCKFLCSGDKSESSFDIIFLCVKPKDMEAAINENITLFSDDQIVVSVAAGITIEKIKNLVKKNSDIIRAMPNLCAIFNESITGICFQSNIIEDKKKYVEDIFRCIGYVREIDEKEVDSFTALFGSGPAYIIYFIESLMKCEKFTNISESDKSLLILNMLSSTSKMMFVAEDIKYLRQMITSKGGTTEAAVKFLEERNFSEIIENAVGEAATRSKELSK